MTLACVVTSVYNISPRGKPLYVYKYLCTYIYLSDPFYTRRRRETKQADVKFTRRSDFTRRSAECTAAGRDDKVGFSLGSIIYVTEVGR
jgi:hypothetical protein